MFGGQGGFGGNPFAGGMQEMASDYMINQFVPGGLNGKTVNVHVDLAHH
jgi:hypothetical protein